VEDGEGEIIVGDLLVGLGLHKVVSCSACLVIRPESRPNDVVLDTEIEMF
jgi:hypothetical protein